MGGHMDGRGWAEDGKVGETERIKKKGREITVTTIFAILGKPIRGFAPRKAGAVACAKFEFKMQARKRRGKVRPAHERCALPIL